MFSPLSYLFFHEYMKSHIASRNSMDSAQMVEAADGTLVPVADAGNLFQGMADEPEPTSLGRKSRRFSRKKRPGAEEETGKSPPK